MDRSRWLRVFMSTALFVSLLAPAGVPTAGAATPEGAITWTVDHEAKTISVMVRIEIYSGCSGDPVGTDAEQASACNLPRSMLGGPTQFLADKIKRGVERIWNKPYRYFCYELKFEIDVKLGTDRESLSADRIGVRIDPSPAGIRSYVHTVAHDANWQSEDPADRIQPENGGWETTWAESASANTFAHEYGHLVGLHDAYRDVPSEFVPGEITSEPLPGAPIDLMSSDRGTISQETINKVVRRNFPEMRDTSGNPVTEDDIKCDYQGAWTGSRMTGTIRYCGKTENPYWGMDLTAANGDRAFVSYLIPPGSETPVQGEITTPFVTDLNKYLDGPGSFIPGDPPHFLVDIAEGTFIVKLDEGTFCNYPAPQ